MQRLPILDLVLEDLQKEKPAPEVVVVSCLGSMVVDCVAGLIPSERPKEIGDCTRDFAHDLLGLCASLRKTKVRAPVLMCYCYCSFSCIGMYFMSRLRAKFCLVKKLGCVILTFGYGRYHIMVCLLRRLPCSHGSPTDRPA